uniref:Uncharacterized protein n=1 Tax=Polytomella parva TaxID=51329 RepID=A0A7S0UZR6_9CHLO
MNNWTIRQFARVNKRGIQINLDTHNLCQRIVGFDYNGEEDSKVPVKSDLTSKTQKSLLSELISFEIVQPVPSNGLLDSQDKGECDEMENGFSINASDNSFDRTLELLEINMEHTQPINIPCSQEKSVKLQQAAVQRIYLAKQVEQVMLQRQAILAQQQAQAYMQQQGVKLQMAQQYSQQYVLQHAQQYAQQHVQQYAQHYSQLYTQQLTQQYAQQCAQLVLQRQVHIPQYA